MVISLKRIVNLLKLINISWAYALITIKIFWKFLLMVQKTDWRSWIRFIYRDFKYYFKLETFIWTFNTICWNICYSQIFNLDFRQSSVQKKLLSLLILLTLSLWFVVLIEIHISPWYLKFKNCFIKLYLIFNK